MITAVGLRWIVEHKDEDTKQVRKKLHEDSFTYLGDWSIQDSLEELKDIGIWTRLFEITAMIREVIPE